MEPKKDDDKLFPEALLAFKKFMVATNAGMKALKNAIECQERQILSLQQQVKELRPK